MSRLVPLEIHSEWETFTVSLSTVYNRVKLELPALEGIKVVSESVLVKIVGEYIPI